MGVVQHTTYGRSTARADHFASAGCSALLPTLVKKPSVDVPNATAIQGQHVLNFAG